MRIEAATEKVAATSTGAIALGRMCRRIRRRSELPRAREAITYSWVFTLRISARMRRATPVQPVSPMTTIIATTAHHPSGESRASMVTMIKKEGIDRKISTTRITTASTRPP